jgi:hypothetical protein
MTKTDSLFQLIQSLTKAEKRYFKLYTSLQKGAKDYLYLFKLIDASSDMTKVKETFAASKKNSVYEPNAKYLYKVVIDVLFQFKSEADKTSRLINSLMKARILFEKSLYEDGFYLLEKIQAEAENNEEFIIQLWAIQIELYYMSNLNFHTVNEKKLVQKQMKIDELLKYQKNIHQHTSLYELLRHRLMYKGTVRTKEQKAELNDLVVSELNYNANPLADTFESEKIHLLFQSYYFITINDHKSALKTFYELIDLLDNNKHLWIERPIDYLSTIEGILDSLLSIKQYTEIQLFLKRLSQIEIKSTYFDVMVERVKFIYTASGYINTGEFEKAEQLKQQFELSLFKRIQYLDLSKQAEVYLYTAIIYIGKGDMNKAHINLNKVLLESKLYYSLPTYRTFRLLHLVIHFEQGNHDYIEYEARSLKRTFSKEYNKSYQIEKIVFRFVQNRILPSSLKAREIIWQKFEVQFEKISKDKYEMQLLRIFDFAAWMEAKLLRRQFSEILRERENIN